MEAQALTSLLVSCIIPKSRKSCIIPKAEVDISGFFKDGALVTI
jgi:hypothetical protein